MPRVNYQRDKRQRDLARQRKQEEKRQKKAMKDQGTTLPAEPLEGEDAVAGPQPELPPAGE